MKAAVHARYGPPEVVRLVDVPKPIPSEDELLVKVHATTVNRTDSHYRAAKPFPMRFLSGLTKPRVAILGTEFAGEIETVGGAVTSFAVGDRVFGYCEGRFGAHAEYVVVPSSGRVAAIPPALSFEEAAPGTEGSHYALASINRARVTRDQDVLVYGASGAIGSAAVQLLKARGARVTAVCATRQVELAHSLGADRVVDYTRENFASGGQRYDLILDAWGGLSYFRCTRLFKPTGIYISSGGGPLGLNLFLTLASPLFRRGRLVFAYPTIDQSTVRYLADLLATGQFRPVIDRTYPFEQIVEAYHYVETGQKVGNVVVQVVSPNDGE